ncbi:MAG: acetyltransferase [Bryobacteraceae bacterium]|nr:acetyltransferase [Bryobacteraceae bacterium]
MKAVHGWCAPTPRSGRGTRRTVKLAVSALLLSLPGTGLAQVLMKTSAASGVVRIHNTDMAVLEAQDPRKDLPCVVTWNKPVLGFDLRFHTNYEVGVPLREMVGKENLLTILFRVTPQNPAGERRYFMQRVRVPEIEESARGDAFLQGGFDIGEGVYKVDWLMRDRTERVCSSYWDMEASLPDRDKQIDLALTAGEIAEMEFEQFKEEPPVIRASGKDCLNVKVLVNFAPQNARAATLQPVDTSALVSILRTISRESRIGKFSLVAFNLHEQRIIQRQDRVTRIDFPALGSSLESLNLGTIDLRRLSEEDGEVRFLTELLRQELLGDRPDAVIFAGPKALLEKSPPRQELEALGEIPFPVFYMNYNLYPRVTPWRDAIGNAVRYFKGVEYTISRPRDLWYAVTEMVSRVTKFKEERQLPPSSTE